MGVMWVVMPRPGSELATPLGDPRTYTDETARRAAQVVVADHERAAAEAYGTSVLGLRVGLDLVVRRVADDGQNFYREYARKGSEGRDAFSAGGWPSDPVTLDRGPWEAAGRGA